MGRVLIALLVTLVVIVGIAYSQLNSVIPSATEEYGPQALKVDVTLDKADLAIFSGSAKLSNFALGQPEGYGEGNMFSLQSIAMALEIDSLLSNHVIIDDIQIDRPAIEAILVGEKSNFEAFVANLDQADTDTSDTPAEDFTMTIRKLTVTEPSMRVVKDGALAIDETIKLASFELTDLGTDEKGLTPQEITRHIMDFLYPQVAKVMVEQGLQSKINDLAGGNLKDVAAGLKEKTGDSVGGLIEGTVGGLLDGQKNNQTDQSSN